MIEHYYSLSWKKSPWFLKASIGWFWKTSSFFLKNQIVYADHDLIPSKWKTRNIHGETKQDQYTSNRDQYMIKKTCIITIIAWHITEPYMWIKTFLESWKGHCKRARKEFRISEYYLRFCFHENSSISHQWVEFQN